MRVLLEARRVPRGAVLSLAIGAAFASVTPACGDEATARPPASDAGIDDAAVALAVCPSTAPAEGTGCTLPEGTTCDFGRCATRIALCTRGAWRFAANTPPLPACPLQPPDLEATCPPCWPEGVTCVYGSQDCSQPDASPNTAVASCVGDRWSVDIRPCRDGGADVQRDGGADAD
jgi:hypothetical protein